MSVLQVSAGFEIALTDYQTLPLAVSIEGASPYESQLVEGVLGHSFLDTLLTAAF
jgi:hypothetical protein